MFEALRTSSQGLRLGSAMECMLIFRRQCARVAGPETHRSRSSVMLHQARKTNTAMSPRLEVRFGIVRYAVFSINMTIHMLIVLQLLSELRVH
jgi:hypothetical protein